ncbi:MAG TPA: OB-fold domain-containing protein [Nocardioides sp.]|nr:OB-fold domain-containing protein [Nocardioides sp.]
MDVRPHIEGLRVGELRVARCGACGVPAFPPPRRCPRCGAHDAADWFTASGRGTVWSFAVFHKTYLPGHPAPYPVAVVELAEGPRLVTTLTGLPPEDLRDIRVGRAVTAEIDAHREPPRVVFRPDPEGAAR